MAPKDETSTTTDPIPFGAMEAPARGGRGSERGAGSKKAKPGSQPAADQERAKSPETETGGQSQRPAKDSNGGEGDDPSRKDYRKSENRRGNSRRGGRRRRKRKQEEGEGAENTSDRRAPDLQRPREEQSKEGGENGPRRGRRRRRRCRSGAGGETRTVESEPSSAQVGSGMFIAEVGGYGTLRSLEKQYLPSKLDIFVPQRTIQRFKLRDGSIVEGTLSKGKKYKYQLENVTKVDGEDPKKYAQLRSFKSLTTIDPDFHYAVGDVTGEVSMRILDILSPVGRGQRGLIVAQPRTGKTTLMRQFAKGIELGYPDVHLFVLLVDERPEEATDWVRSTNGQVFVSTSDETPKNHVRLAEAVWKRCQRLVELGEDVVLILDSITRLARAYNNSGGGTGRTMSGGLDSRAMERPRQIFGSARNTETAGSLTILGTALIDTGSRMDQLIFEEFKGTGNMEVMLNRKLADRRIFPAIDIEKSGTRKEEKLISSKRLKRINVLRRVLLRMNFVEAMELLSEKLLDVEKTEDFLQRFDVDPEA